MLPQPRSSMIRVVVLLSLAGLVPAARPLAAQGPPVPAEVSAAQTALTSGDADGAIRTLEAYFRQHPSAVAGRLLLARAYDQKGDLDRALATYLAIDRPRPSRIQALFGAAGVEARRGRVDEAFELLTRLKATGAFDMDLVRTTPAFAGLERDPRFDGLAFKPADFADPFVEPVHVIHEWRGEAKGDQFSWIARGIGDVDGDGASDLVTSAPTWGAHGQPSGPGKVYVYSGRSGRLLWSRAGKDQEGLGTGLEAAGDVNGDGAGDVIAGAPGGDRAYVYSGRDGRVLLTLEPDLPGERFGASAAGAGDQNGDGVPDLVVGAPGAGAKGRAAGRAYLFSGKDGSRITVLDGEKAGDGFGSIVAGARNGRETPLLIGAPGAGPNGRGRVYAYRPGGRAVQFAIDADSTGAALGGMFTSLVGDVDGDHVLDVYASDFTNSAKGPSTGRVYVYSGKDGRRLYTFTGEGPGDGFGIGSADVGDVNRDGYADLVVGAWQYSAAAASGGKVYLYSGKDGSLLRTITGRIPGETLGFDATGIGDVDGDGVVDLLLTSSWSNVHGFRSGRMFVISGR
jgi:Tetratricopeptide repeat/FG-GAP-like repeat/FG-GAP repeat